MRKRGCEKAQRKTAEDRTRGRKSAVFFIMLSCEKEEPKGSFPKRGSFRAFYSLEKRLSRTRKESSAADRA